MQPVGRLVWVHRDYFDKALDRATWLEMIDHLAQQGWDVTLLTGFKAERVPFPTRGRIRYLPSIKIPVLNVMSFLLAAYCYLIYQIVRKEVTHVILDSMELLV